MAQKTKQKSAGPVKGWLKKLGWNFFVSIIPAVGDFWPAFTIFVWKETKENRTAADAILMLPIAVFADMALMVVGLVDWGVIGFLGMLLRLLGWAFFYSYFWFFKKSQDAPEDTQEEESPEQLPATSEPQSQATPPTKEAA